MNWMRSKNLPLQTFHVLQHLKSNHTEWVNSYLSNKPNQDTASESLSRLCRLFMARHGFSWRRASAASKLTNEELEARKKSFAKTFWHEYSEVGDEHVMNVDETGVFYDTPPRYIWTQKGGPSTIDFDEKSSQRLTAVLSIR
jgi:hypothetical protein